MSLLDIADAIGVVKDLCETEDVRSVGATLFVGKRISDEEKEAIESELRPQKVKRLDKKVTRVDL